jgi:hypothetical protein
MYENVKAGNEIGQDGIMFSEVVLQEINPTNVINHRNMIQ